MVRSIVPLALGCTLVAGCLTGLPPDPDPRHMEIRWRADVVAAQREARATNKPLLIVGVAGDITGEC
jgi:hypothetical protein